MKKKLIVLGGAVLVLTMIFAVISVIAGSHKTICDKFIGDIRQNKADDSYILYSATVQGELSAKEWAAEVNNLSSAYGADGTLKLTNTSASTKDAVVTTQNSYNLATDTGNYTLSCIVIDAGKEHAVDAFSSSKY